MKTPLLRTLAIAGLALPLHSAPLTESTFTEVVKSVEVVARTTKAATPARPDELFKAPDLVRTGPDSRAELTAPDQTITRVGANTVFSFEPVGRDLNLERGSVLFHSPKGAGGGTIKSGGVAAAVLGTTLIVSATTDGGFKVILLEGKGRVTLSNGKSAELKAGQEVFVLPGGTKLSAVLDINLGKLVAGSLLVKGFSQELVSWPLIQQAISRQQAQMASGQAIDTGVPADLFAGPRPPGNGLDTMNPGTYQNAVHQPLNTAQFNQLFQSQSQTPGGLGGRPVNVIGNVPQG